MKRLAITFTVALTFLLTGCNEERMLKNIAWEYQLKQLKSPSTAKLVDGRVTVSDSDKINRFNYARAYPAVETLTRLIDNDLRDRSYLKESALMKGLGEYGEHSVSMEEANAVRKLVEDGKGHEAFKALLELRSKYFNKMYEDYEMNKAKVKFHEVGLSYDAQNSYGAILRESNEVFIMRNLPWHTFGPHMGPKAIPAD